MGFQIKIAAVDVDISGIWVSVCRAVAADECAVGEFSVLIDVQIDLKQPRTNPNSVLTGIFPPALC